MERTEAQKQADKRYAQKTKGKHKQFAVNFIAAEYEEIIAIIAKTGMSKADFIRWAVKQWNSK